MHTNKRYIKGVLACLALVAHIACSPAFAAKERTMTTKETSLPAATQAHRQIVSHAGWLNTERPLTADDLRGRIILLDFWTFCCINCMHIMPDLAYLEQTFGDRLAVIGVHSAKFANERDTQNIRQAILRHDIRHPVVNDFDFAIWQSFAVHAWPTLVLINPDGMVEATYSGEGHRAQLEKDIRGLLTQYDGKVNTRPLPIALEKEKAPPHVLNFPTKMIYVPDYPGRSALVLSDTGNRRVLVLSTDGRIIDTIGSGKQGYEDGEFDMASFTMPQGLAWDGQALYIADTGSHTLRAAHVGMREVSRIAGTSVQGYERRVKDKPALNTAMASPWDITPYPDTKHLAIAMAGTHQLWGYDPATRTVSVMAGNGRESIDDGAYPNNSLSQPSGLTAVGDTLYFVDAETSSLRKLHNGVVTTLVGTGLFDFGLKDGSRQDARMQHAIGLAADEKTVYIADSYNHAIRSYDIASGVLSTLAGNGTRGHQDGAFSEATFNEPNDITLVDGKLYVTDTNNHAIRVIDLAAMKVSTLPVSDSGSMVDRFSDALPNLQALPVQQVASQGPVTVRLDLPHGWKVNADAPSSLTLFAMQGDAHNAVARFDRDKMHDRQLVLPKMEPGQYRLQGTLYYCEDKAGSQCLLASFDVTLEAGSGVPVVTLPLKAQP